MNPPAAPRPYARLQTMQNPTAYFVEVVKGDEVIMATFERDTEAEAWQDAKAAALAILRDCPLKAVPLAVQAPRMPAPAIAADDHQDPSDPTDPPDHDTPAEDDTPEPTP